LDAAAQPRFAISASAVQNSACLISLDLRGLNCPLPALRTRKALRCLSEGVRLIVECTDPLSVIDIPHLLRETGDTLERQEAENGLYVFHILRGTS
jgi:tRNA 2-thiouridine synthesizing protein A